MSRLKRFQIPVDEQENSLFQKAAQRAGLPAAEWARRQLKKDAQHLLSMVPLMTAQEALKKIFALNAPVGTVDEMIEESTNGKYDSLY